MKGTLAAVIVVLAAWGLLGCNEILDAHYDSLDVARKQGAIERGWIPRFAPPTASNIHERHDLDTNAAWGVLDFSSADAVNLRAQLKPLSEEELTEQEIRKPGKEWWPPELEGRLDAVKLKAAGLDVFRESEGFSVAIDWKKGRLYFWTRR